MSCCDVIYYQTILIALDGVFIFYGFSVLELMSSRDAISILMFECVMSYHSHKLASDG